MTRASSLFVAVLLVASACTSSPEDPTTTTVGANPSSTTLVGEASTSSTTTDSTDDTAVTSTGDSIVVMVDAIRAVALADAASRYTADTGVEVIFDVVEFGGILDRADDDGIDVFMGPHTWMERLIDEGAIVPIQNVESGDWSDRAAEAFLTGQGMMAVPFAAESLVLYRNTDLLSERVDDLTDGCGEIPTTCVVIPGLGSAGGYHLAPFVMSGANAALAETLSDPSRRSLDAFVRLIDSGVMELVSTSSARQAFADGSAVLFVGGPWDLGPIEDAGVRFAVQPLPRAAGESLAAPVSVLGFYQSATAPAPDAATMFLSRYVAAADTQRDLWLRDRRATVLTALDDVDPRATAFSAGVAGGFLLPSVDLEIYWEELGAAIEEIVGGADPVTAVRAAAERISARTGT